MCVVVCVPLGLIFLKCLNFTYNLQTVLTDIHIFSIKANAIG